MRYGSYLVCKEHLEAVKDFLNDFFDEERGEYNFSDWVSFKFPNSQFLVHLMKGDDQPLTQNITFEIYTDSLEILKELAEKHDAKVKDFVASSAPQKYRYYYAEVVGPKDICKVEMSFVEDIQT